MNNAVAADRVSSIIGYNIKPGDSRVTSPNLPIRIAILGEANEANQAGLDLTPKEISSAQQAGTLYGFGSPIHQQLRILKPLYGEGVGAIPIWVYPQAKAAGAAAKVMDVTPTGNATKNGTHTVTIAGRGSLDNGSYDINIVVGDTPALVCDKIVAALNGVLGCPVIAVDATTKVTCTAKWNGLTSQGLNITINTNGVDLGVTYAVTQVTAGSGSPTVGASLALFGSNWNTYVINTYGAVTAIMTELEVFNGKPDTVNPTGRYQGPVMKPFVALTGTVLDDPSSLSDARLNECTIAFCPAPGSAGLPAEAAANMCVLLARQTQDAPHLDVQGRKYPDMPTPVAIGSMSDHNNRDAFVKKGCSTVDLNAGKYEVVDFVTTYHPAGENPPSFRWVRDLVIDWNIWYGFQIILKTNVVGKAIANNDDVVDVDDVIKPKGLIKLTDSYAEDTTKRALTADPKFMQDSITVDISGTNPNRFDSFFKYKRTGFGRIVSSVGQANFNFGNS